MFSYQILNHPDSFTIDEARVSQIFSLVSEVLPVEYFQNGILNIAFLSDDEIQTLNREHRGIDKSTDVLSFHYFDDCSAVASDEVAGEIILSESKIMSQSAELGHPARQEFEILIIHSILHILGFDHETDEEYQEMWKWEERLRSEILETT